MSTFFSYRETDAPLVHCVKRMLDVSLPDIVTLLEEKLADQDFTEKMQKDLPAARNFVLFVSGDLGDYQLKELTTFYQLLVKKNARKAGDAKENRRLVIVCLFDKSLDDSDEFFGNKLALWAEHPRIHSPGMPETAANALAIAHELAEALMVQWRYVDGLPADPHLFDYEKDIIQYFQDVHRFFPNSMGELCEGLPDALEKKAGSVFNKWLKGCPEHWPEVERCGEATHDNPLPPGEIGNWRKPGARVLVKALRLDKDDELEEQEDLDAPEEGTAPKDEMALTFLEAGPRKKLYFPSDESLKVAIVVSGGIAPGVNAVIDGIVQRHWQYAKRHYGNNVEIYGLQDGFLSFSHDQKVLLLADSSQPKSHKWTGPVVFTPDHAHEGGSILGTSRVGALLHADDRVTRLQAFDEDLRKAEIDILYVIGGDGTMKAAHALYEVARQNEIRRETGQKLSVVSIPKTMDNDILWVWQSFGFLSAVEKGREVIEHLSTEVESNPRLCVVQLFGSDSGFVVSHAVLASSTGHCVAALIPEVEFSMKGKNGLIAHVKKALKKKDGRPPHGIIVMAETAIPQDAQDYVDDPDIGLSSVPDGERLRPIRDALAEKEELRRYLDLRAKKKRIQGQTEDALRSAGLKIVSRGLLKGLAANGEHKAHEDWNLLRVFTNEPRHLLRAIPPSCLDIIIGQRLGTLAVDNAMAGYTDFMISQWLTEYVLVPLRLVVLGRKRIPETGMFWKSVLAKTGQPAVMVDGK
jgi:6-phosphofructokinase 1